MSPDPRDFISSLTPIIVQVKTYDKTTTRELHRGTIRWYWHDDSGNEHQFDIPNSYYDPAGTRLLSPQHWARETKRTNKFKGGTVYHRGDDEVTELHWGDHMRRLQLTTNGVADLPARNTDKQTTPSSVDLKQELPPLNTVYCQQVKHVSPTFWESDPALKPELDKLPKTLNKLNFATDSKQTPRQHQNLLWYHQRLGHISNSKIRRLAKAGILPTRLQFEQEQKCLYCIRAKSTRRQWRHRTPKHKQRVKLIPGQVTAVDQLSSDTLGLIAQMTGIPTRHRYVGATVYVDLATRYTYIVLQTSLDADETIKGKEQYEQHMKDLGHNVQAYHADNGIFAANKWRQHCRNRGQALTFAGVGAHHQNGVAERKIRDLQDLARAMLLHAQDKWPGAITSNLWPYAIRMANDLNNNTPLIRDNDDDNRSPYQRVSGSTVDINVSHWHTFGAPVYPLLAHLQQEPRIHDKWATRTKDHPGIYLGHSPQHARTIGLVLDTLTGLTSPQFHVVVDDRFDTVSQTDKHDQWQTKCGFKYSRKQHQTATSVGQTAPSQPQPPATTTLPDLTPEGQTIPPTRRSTRIRKIPERLTYASQLLITACTTIFCQAASSDPDVMYLHEARKEKDWPQFQEAMQQEIDGQIQHKNFRLRKRADIDTSTPILPGVWVLKRKRKILTGEIYKWKARLNLDGSRQIKGVHYDRTYAPVASWSIIRLLLVLVLSWNWKARQIDYILAFTQAPTERPMFMSVPKGYTVSEGDPNDYVLEILANTYGAKQAPKQWYDYLRAKLKEAGWERSDYVPTVFYNVKRNLLYVLYVDDSILFGPTDEAIQQGFEELQRIRLEVTMEGNLSDFLGAHIEELPDGSFHLHQSHQIKKVINDLGLAGPQTTRKNTPCKISEVLKRDKEGPDHDDSFHYRSVTGKLSHVDRCTRLDIACVVHQCARFSSAQKLIHTKALKWLGRYLKATQDFGFVIKPDFTRGLELLVDSDWAGNWDPLEPELDPDTARSRFGFIILFAGVVIGHGSRLLHLIALSSTEAEYMGLSEAVREVLPLIDFLNELRQRGFKLPDTPHKAKCKIFEDNSGAIEIANADKIRPRTKHINVRYHHFRQLVEKGTLVIESIRSEDNPADILTHPVTIERLAKHLTTLLKWHLLPAVSEGVLQYLKQAVDSNC